MNHLLASSWSLFCAISPCVTAEMGLVASAATREPPIRISSRARWLMELVDFAVHTATDTEDAMARDNAWSFGTSRHGRMATASAIWLRPLSAAVIAPGHMPASTSA